MRPTSNTPFTTSKRPFFFFFIAPINRCWISYSVSFPYTQKSYVSWRTYPFFQQARAMYIVSTLHGLGGVRGIYTMPGHILFFDVRVVSNFRNAIFSSRPIHSDGCTLLRQRLYTFVHYSTRTIAATLFSFDEIYLLPNIISVPVLIHTRRGTASYARILRVRSLYL